MRTEKERTPLHSYVWNRVKKHKNAIIVTNGETGSGKTYASATLGFELSLPKNRPFTVEGNIAFDFVSLLKKMQRPENRKPGTVFLFEEVGSVGSGASSHQWQSMQNKFFDSFVQTSRHRRQVLLFTCPLFTNLTAGVRKLVHIQLDQPRIDFEEKRCWLKPFMLQTNTTSGKTYRKYLRFHTKERSGKLGRVSFGLPPDDWVEEYERAKTQFTDKLNREILESENKQEKRSNQKVDREKLMEYCRQGLEPAEIAAKFGCALRTIQNHLKVAGYELDLERKRKIVDENGPLSKVWTPRRV